MSSGQLTAALISAVAIVIVAVIGWVSKNQSASPEKRTALDAGWDKLTGGLERRLAALEASDLHKDQLMNDQARKIEFQAMQLSELQTKLAMQSAEFNKVATLNAWLIRRVATLTAFIVGAKLTPPPEEPRPFADED